MSFSEFSEFHHAIEILAGTQGSYVNGRWVKSSGEAKTIQGSVQPIGSEIEVLNIGRRDLRKVYLYTDSSLKIANKDKATNGDVFVADGEIFEVIGKEPWKNGIIPHTKYIGEYRRQAE